MLVWESHLVWECFEIAQGNLENSREEFIDYLT